MFDPQLKLLARSLLEFPASLSEEEYYQILVALLTHLSVTPSENFRLLAKSDWGRHLLKYLAHHYDERTGDAFLKERQLYPKIKETIAYLQELGSDSSVFFKAMVARALRQLGSEDERVMDALLRDLADNDSFVRQGALVALGRMGFKDEQVVEVLLRDLADNNRVVRQGALVALGQMGFKDERVMDALLRDLADNDSFVRKGAIVALGRMRFKDEQVVDALLRDLADNDRDVRQKAAVALGQLKVKDPQVMDALLQVLSGSGYENIVRHKAAVALGRLGIKTVQVVEVLLRGLADNDRVVRQGAVIALGHLVIKDERVMYTLLRDLADNDCIVRHTAAVTLVKLGIKDERVVDVLLRDLNQEGYLDYGRHRDRNYKRNAMSAAALLRILFLEPQAFNELEISMKRKITQQIDGVVSYLVKFAASASIGDLQTVFDTPHAVPMIIQGSLDESSTDRIYYVLLFFAIRKLRLTIAHYLLPVLSDPDKDERTKQLIFRLLLRVELIEDDSS
jgi:HEAT repeat protein